MNSLFITVCLLLALGFQQAHSAPSATSSKSSLENSIAADKSIVRVIDNQQYTVVKCEDPSNCQVSLDATNGKAVAVSVSPGDETLVRAVLDHETHLYVYYNIIKESNLMDKYDWTSAITSLPRTQHSDVIYYVIDQGHATLTLSRK